MIWTVIFIVSIAQGLFLISLLLGLGSRNSIAARLMATLVLVMVITNLDYLLTVTELYRSLPNLFGMSFGMMLLLGPLFYCYACSVTDSSFSWQKRRYFHFVPYGLNVLLNVPFYLIDAPTKTALIESFVSGTLPFGLFDAVMISIQSSHLAIYLFFTLKRLKSIERGYGNLSFVVSMNRRVAWLKSIFFCLLAFLLTVVALLVFILIKQNYVPDANFSYTLVTSIIIYLIAYKLVLDPGLIHPDFEKKYKTYKPLDQGAEQGHLKKLDDLLNREKIFLNPDLKLADLSVRLDLPSHLVSKLINERLGKSFNDLVNEFRVQEFVALVNDPEFGDRSVLEIAYEVGFNSKSSFNSTVKKVAGKTPSELRERPER